MKRNSRTRQHPRVVSVAGDETHVLVPKAAYERLVEAELLLQAMTRTEGDKAKFIDADDAFIRIAGRRIADARKAQGISQAELARRLGLTQSQVSRIEQNPDQSRVSTLKRVAAVLHVDVRELVLPIAAI